MQLWKFTLLFLSFSIFAFHSYAENEEIVNASFEENCCPNFCAESCLPYYAPFRFHASGVVGNGFGLDRRRASVGLFGATPMLCEEWQPFFDLQAHYLSHHEWAGNVGAGVRKWVCDNRAVGANIYYDYRDARRSFNQIGVGLESLGECFDFRINGYFPVGRKTRFFHPHVFDFPGGFIMICRERKFAHTGFDADVGRYFCLCAPFKFYSSLGTYYYRHKHFNHFWGGAFRLKAFLKDWLSFELRLTYDKVFHTRAQGIFTASFPLDNLFKNCEGVLDYCRNLLLQPVNRQEVIILDRSCCWRTNF